MRCSLSHTVMANESHGQKDSVHSKYFPQGDSDGWEMPYEPDVGKNIWRTLTGGEVPSTSTFHRFDVEARQPRPEQN